MKMTTVVPHCNFPNMVLYKQFSPLPLPPPASKPNIIHNQGHYFKKKSPSELLQFWQHHILLQAQQAA